MALKTEVPARNVHDRTSCAFLGPRQEVALLHLYGFYAADCVFVRFQNFKFNFILTDNFSAFFREVSQRFYYPAAYRI